MPQRLNAYLGTSRELAQLSAKVELLQAMQCRYEQAIPPSLSNASRVVQIEGQTLTLAADNGAVAAKLRQIAPRLVRLLHGNGHEVTGIRVKVQVTLPPVSSVVPSGFSSAGKQKLASAVSDLPDSPLKRALQKLAQKREP